MARAVPALLALIALAMTVRPGEALGQGSLTLTATASGNVVTVDVTIVDHGGAPDCGGFHLVRGTVFWPDPGTETRCIPRQVGTTTTHHFEDVLPTNRAYYYTVVGMSCLAPCVCICPSDQTAFYAAFGSPWGLGFHSYVNIGPPESTVVGHGQVTSTGWAYPTHALLGCPGKGSWGALASPDAVPYADTGTELLVFGAPFFDVQNGSLLRMSSVQPWPCNSPVSAQQRSWGRLKSLYRE
jgi:hypothetical protein